jgi:hypothetical protein
MRCHTTWIAAAHGAAALKCQVEVPGGSARWKCHVEVPRGSATWKWGGHNIMGGAAQSPENVTWKRHMEALPGYF